MSCGGWAIFWYAVFSMASTSFTIEPLGESRVCFTQREVFTGLLNPCLARGLDTDTWRGLRNDEPGPESKGGASRLMVANRRVIT